MSPFGSNFHHDSFEWIGPPRKPWNPPTSFNYRSNTDIKIDFSGIGRGMQQTAKWNFFSNLVSNLTGLGAALMLSKGNNLGATILNMGGSIFNGFGGGFGGGFNGVSTGYLIDNTYINPYSLMPTLPNISPPENPESNLKPETETDTKTDLKPETETDTKTDLKPETETDPETEPTKADILNDAVDDALDANNDGIVDDSDIFSGDAYNIKHELQHTISEVGNKNGVKRGTADGKYPKGENADTKTDKGFYKYITVTDKNSGNEWTFEYIDTNDNGDPIYKFNPKHSDLSKDDDKSKDWDITGKEPEYTVTVDKKSKQIKFVSSGDIYAASAKGLSGKIPPN